MATRRALALAPLLGALLLGACAHSQPEPTTVSWVSAAEAVERTDELTPADIVSLRSVGDVEIAPDGKHVLYTLSVPRPLDDPGGSRSQIWMVDAAGKHLPRRFTAEDASSWRPRWAPDGDRFAFLSKRPGDSHVALYAMPIDGGEPEVLLEAEASIGTYAWSPDGSRIAYTMTEPTDDEQTELDAGRDWIVDEAGGTKTRLFVHDLGEDESREVVTSGEHVIDFAWSPDGERLAVHASARATTDHVMMYSSLYTVAATGGTLEPLTKTEGKLGGMAWSPNGKTIAFLGAADLSDSTAGIVYVVPATGGEAKPLTADDEATGNLLTWKDDKTIVSLATRSTKTVISQIPAAGGPGKVMIDSGPMCADLSINDKGALACSGDTASHPREVFVGKLGSPKLRRVTVSNHDLLDRKLGEQVVIQWQAEDGLELEGIVIKPVGFESGTRYPLAVLPHGGPEGVSRNGWQTRPTYPAQLFATRGYVVFMPNYRGSAGRGTAFAKADHNDLGGQEFNDVLAGIDHLVAQGWVDGDRVGMGGWSYGGYFSGLAATMHSERFKAAMIAAAITNWISFTGTTEIEHENSLVHWNQWPWDDMALPWDRSPLAHMKGSKTAALIVHGAADERVPPGQSLELYRGLKRLGVTTQLVLYPREGHGIRENVHGLDFMNRFVDWFDTHVKG